MKYLLIALISFIPIQFIYIIITEAYENFGNKLDKLHLVMKFYRYTIAIACLIAAIFWRGAEPPILDMSKLQTSEGIVECKNTTARGIYGTYKMNGIKYVRAFGYVFGTGSGGISCEKSISGHNGKIMWLPIYNNSERLIFQISDMETKRIHGLTVEKSYERHKKSIEDKTWFYLSKIALFFLALQFAFWERANKFHKLFTLKQRKV